MTLSLQARLLLAALLVLMVFTGLTGLALDKAFRQSAETALQDRLQGYLYALLAAVDVDDSGTLNPADVQLGTTQTFSGGTLTFSGLSFLISSGTPENLLIVFDISMGASVGVTVGCIIIDNSD